MQPKEKAAKSIALLREAVLDILKQNSQGLQLGSIAKELGLNFDTLPPDNNRFMQKFMNSFLLTENPVKVKSEKIGNKRLYFFIE